MVEGVGKMTGIGGYFELADRDEQHEFPIKGALLNTGRNALEYIIRSIPRVQLVYLPLFTCEVVLEPLKKLHIPYQFYHITNKFEIEEDIKLQEDEYLIANNYFGLKDAYIKNLADKYGTNLIVDNAQALFMPAIPNIKAFYSTRKYVGVADGGVAVGVDEKPSFCLDYEDTSDHDNHLLIRRERGAEAGFKEYQQNEGKLDNQPIRQMSASTRDILAHVDYEKIIARRKANYEYLHYALGEKNQLQLPTLDTFACPMVYPYVGRIDSSLRNHLIQNKVYVARYWPNVLNWSTPSMLEYELAERLLPLPIDQRYGEKNMDTIINKMNRYEF